MKLFGFELSIKKTGVEKSTGGWRPVRGSEHRPAAWQLGEELSKESQLGFFAVYACVNLIANDIGKLRPFIYKKGKEKIKVEVENHEYDTLLRRPNHYQNHIQFKNWWAMSKLTSGNAYILKQRDASGKVVGLYILDPWRTRPMVAEDGEVFYQIAIDNINKIKVNELMVPASEIMHDRINCLYHPLVGISPLYACGLSAGVGLAIQQNSQNFFRNGQQPSGILTAPGTISKETSERLKAAWNENYGGKNYGKVAVVGDGMRYEPMAMTANDSQLIEQLKLSGEVVCSAFGVPAYMIQIGAAPSHNNAETMVLQYYSQCLQSHIEQMELCLGEGLGLPKGMGIEFDLEGLLRMDTPTKYKTMADSIKGGLFTPNEARMKVNAPPLTGGDSIYMQQQNYSMEALARRDQQPDPFNPTSGDSEVEVDFDGERTFKFFGKEFRLPVVIDRGVYDAEKSYQRGDAVSHGGGLWIAQVDQPDHKPSEGKGWRLAVKRGAVS